MSFSPLIRCLLTISVIHRGDEVLCGFIDEVTGSFGDIGKQAYSWWEYGNLSAKDAKLCKNGETKHCVQYDSIVAENNYYLYTTWEKWKSPQRLYLDKIDEAFKNPAFRPDKKLVVITHGLTSSYQIDWVQRAKNALLRHNTCVITVDYRSYGDYILLANNNGLIPLAEAIGSKLGDLLEILMKRRWSGSRIHLVGHSLGSHISAYAAKHLKNLGLPVSRITALDPVGIIFDTLEPERRLNKDDADFVDCIFTTPGGIGSRHPFCGANFYANCFGIGLPTTGIITGPAIHSQAREMYVESIYPNHIFEAKKCDGVPCKDVKPEQCSSLNHTIKMGHPASSKHLGLFFVETNAKYPFAKIVIGWPVLPQVRKKIWKPKLCKRKTKKREVGQRESTKERKRRTRSRKCYTLITMNIYC